MPELYLVASERVLYLCGDRSLVIGLLETPAAQRMAQDGFLGREPPALEDSQIRLVLNPASVKPFAMQLQAVRGIAGVLIPQQRQRLLAELPAEAREQLEMQVQSQLGVRDLDEFSQYAERLRATLEQITDAVTSRAAAFEGMTITGSLSGKFNRFSVKLHSQRFEDGQGVGAIPLSEVRRVLAWLGSEYQSFSVTGRRPESSGLSDDPGMGPAGRVRSLRRRGWGGRFSTGWPRCSRNGVRSRRLKGGCRGVTVRAPLRPLPPMIRSHDRGLFRDAGPAGVAAGSGCRRS